jgi:PTS system cellobiose-specific IIA component
MEELELEQENGAEMVSFGIIAHAGDARSYAFGALEAAKAGNFEEAEALLKQSNDAAVEAHHMQTELLVNEANGNKTPVDVLLVHAQDHLMTSMLAVELIKELITIYKNKN